MSSETHVLKEMDNTTDVTYTLAGQTDKGAQYRVSSRSLGLPQSLGFSFNIGNPGSKGNDKVTVALKNTVQNSSTGLVSTGSLTATLSIPRDSEWTDTDSQDLIHQLKELFVTDVTVIKLGDAVTP